MSTKKGTKAKTNNAGTAGTGQGQHSRWQNRQPQTNKIPTGGDLEANAIAACLNALKSLTADARRRVLGYVESRYPTTGEVTNEQTQTGLTGLAQQGQQGQGNYPQSMAAGAGTR